MKKTEFPLQVERLDDPSLIGVPVAVQQFNAGGGAPALLAPAFPAVDSHYI